MKKNENKQKQPAAVPLKQILREDGRKLTWLSGVTKIHYQRLQRIINQGCDPSITEAAKIAAALGRPLTVVFPSGELQKALLHGGSEKPPAPVQAVESGRPEGAGKVRDSHAEPPSGRPVSRESNHAK